MKNGGDQWQVDDELLTETGRGGLFTDGYLQGDPLVSYLDSGETPLFVFGSGKRGVTRVEGDESTSIVPGSGYRAITALTDRRVQFVVGGTDGQDWAASVHLSDIDRVTVEEGLIRSQLTITAGETEWRVYLKDVDGDRVLTFLEEASWAWIQIEQLLTDARKRLVDATQHQKSRSYAAAQERLADAREKLDEASEITGTLAEEATGGMRERIGQIESRYRETKRRAHTSRATHLVDEAERQWRNESYAAAYEAFEDACEQYQTVLDIPDVDPDKAEAVRDRLDHVRRNLDLLSSAPLEHAHEARRNALRADDDEAALTHWSAAFDRYRTVIELDWGKDEKRFRGDVDLLRDRAAEAVDGLLDARRSLAADCRDRGDDYVADGDVSAARESYSEAISHLESARSLAEEFDPDAVADIDDRLDALGTCIEDAAASVAAGETDEADETDYDDFDNWVTLTPEDGDNASEAADDAADEADPEPDVEGPPIPEDGPGPLTDRSTGVSLPLQRTVDRMGVDPADADPEAVETVRALDPDAAVDAVASLWASRGWSTTERGDTALVASRSEPQRETVALLVVSLGSVTAEDVDRCVLERTRNDAGRASLIATTSIDDDARERAAAVDLEVIDARTLTAMLDGQGCLDGIAAPDRANAEHAQ